MSTAFAKAISGCPEVLVLHEPFTDCYYFGPQRRSSRYGDSAAVVDFDAAAAVAAIHRASASTNRTVFFKDLAFQAYHYVPDHLLAQAANTLLIRHPARVMASLMRLKPDFSEEELGFQALDALHRRISDLQSAPPPVLEGEWFRSHPRLILRDFCEAHDLPFSEGMLRWTSGTLRPWLPHEGESQQKWHSTLESSSTILPPEGPAPRLVLSTPQQEMLERALEIYDRLAPHAQPRAVDEAG
jgi:hypothetical protein